MISADYHVHTNYCDGKSKPRETINRALELGFSELGFSGHGYTFCGEDYCMPEKSQKMYVEEIRKLAEEYKGRINILCGVERDYFGADAPWADYIIGSVHHLEFDGEYISVDGSEAGLVAAADKYCGGDIIAFCEVYYEYVARLCEKLSPDIIGHFDLVTKYNEGGRLFDEEDPRYVAAWKAAADKLIESGVPFEINTGAISRGYRKSPYPSAEQVKYIASNGGKFILTSDCHAAENLALEFDKWEPWARSLGAEFIALPKKI